RHVTRRLLLAVRHGKVSYRQLAETLVEQIGELCPGCREEIEAALAEEIPLEDYRDAVAHALEVETQLRRFQEDAEAAPELLRVLRALSPEQRSLRIANSPRRFGNLALGEALVDEARACLPGDPHGSLAWARTLEAVAGAYPVPYEPHRILALAYQGNALRAAGDFEAGRRLLLRAQELLVEREVPDPDVTAELHSFLGSLETDLRRFEEALEHLETAASLYRTTGDAERLARVLMKLGLLHEMMEDLPSALQMDKAALALLSPDDDQALHLAARLNYANHLLEAGHPLRARDVLDVELHLYESEADPHIRLRFDWLQARLAGALGDPAGAERGLLAVRDELGRQGQGFDAAIACLDLAALYHEERRTEDVERAAAQAVELFQAHALHREALAALMLFLEAARARTVTEETLRQVTRALHDAQRGPAARFEPSS
ncbi:MAG TPA: tetratricopeptide repeat protein, partial [Thermoanaerobaculia bacterium]|nr:tetratricopeptide repeat protein [Thermoanaerobaculia bacterium]